MHQKRGYYAYDPNLICSKLVFGIFTEKSRELFWLGKADMLSRQKQSTQKTINSISHYMPRRCTHVEKLGIVLHRKHTSHAHAFTTDASNWCEDCSLINKIFARKISFVVFFYQSFFSPISFHWEQWFHNFPCHTILLAFESWQPSVRTSWNQTQKIALPRKLFQSAVHSFFSFSLLALWIRKLNFNIFWFIRYLSEKNELCCQTTCIHTHIDR